MALVAYSDSESDSEVEPPVPAAKVAAAGAGAPASAKPKSSLASFLPPPAKKRKLVVDDTSTTGPADGSTNHSGPRKIKIDLPKISRDDDDADALPSSSRRNIGKAGGGSGMLSFLPAPKRTGAEAAKVAQEAEKEEKKAEASSAATAAPRTLGGGIKKVEYAGTGMDDAPVEAPAVPPVDAPPAATSKPPTAGPIQGRAIQPLFRKSAAKKPSKSVKTEPKDKKVSLFSLGSALAEKPLSAPSTGEYKPILIDDTAAPPVDDEDTAVDTSADVEATYVLPDDVPAVGPQTFQSISEQVGMDEAEMRMFMGRRGRNAEIKLMDFNVDAEYEKNEAARAAGATAPEKNVVRSIKPGKHQLTSLLNAAQSQRAALEESFAQGRRNKKEAGSKYGW
ncbi:hypothetical protein TWF696_008397 [Orbilia brochopaga]|uniref:Mitotic checkpoint regulator, MAD2B-interacting-domain-containing protein n=1 Tax=Orbilia brochopaga TaxID=3140254 RepID=A0AAV9UFL3_9PEZI